MALQVTYTSTTADKSLVFLADECSADALTAIGLDDIQTAYVLESKAKEVPHVEINLYSHQIFVVFAPKGKTATHRLEGWRVAASKLSPHIHSFKYRSLAISAEGDQSEAVLAFAEGLALSSYQFLRYLKDADKKAHALQDIEIAGSSLNEADAAALTNNINAVDAARTLVNEPVSYLTAEMMSEEIKRLGDEAGFSVEVLNKKQIESLKMGGVLAVNKGSIDPPTFSIMEWKPENAVNEKPIVLVGKGIVYDTGGLSLKPTPNSMDFMKADMGGAAAVIGTMYAVASSKMAVHVIGLVPATDNRPGGNAYAPGDIITMYNGSTVEVLNTDAEGRLVLADALTYAQKYEPELVIDLATLTGAAARAIGTYGLVSMGTADQATHDQLKVSGENVYERLAQQPFWDEYGQEMKSTIADLNNLGSPYGGAITAGKFLEHFTKDTEGEHAYPWIHLDIAGPAFLQKADAYRPKGGTGSGVRLLADFLKNRANE